MNTSKDLVAKTDLPNYSHPFPFFIRYTVPLPKETTSTTAIALQKETHHGNDGDEQREQDREETQDKKVDRDGELEIKKTRKGTGVLRKRFSSTVSNVLGRAFRSKRTSEKFRDLGEGRERRQRSGNVSRGSDQPFGTNRQACKPGNRYGSKLECEDDHRGVQRMGPMKRLDTQLQEMQHSFLGFLDKKVSWHFIKDKWTRVNEKSRNLSVTSPGKEGHVQVGSSFRLVGCGRDNNRPRIVIRRRKLKIARSSQRQVNEPASDEENGVFASIETPESPRNHELCRKRILMGGRCKPLNSSGTLLYDKNGYLIPDWM